ncbi:B3 domain-containing protein [Cardamine amara subsp. amara]|uniref:B3 domain-containing protein n=1 Tax=Cardamine amara subsp. amara TaxID=228776 RepID=A0ABD1A0N4_CARAN
MSLRQYFIPNKNLLSAEEREKRVMQRIFDHIPRRKRTPYSYRRNTRNGGAKRFAFVPKKTVQEDKDVILKRILSNVPRKKRTTDYEYVPPKDPPQARPKPSPKPLQESPKPPSRPRQIITPEWLIQVMRGMDGAEDPKLIILEKTLDVNDVDSHQNRLSIPINSVIQNDFLTLDESRIIDDDDITTNQGKMGVGAFLVDQRTIQWSVGFKQWFMKTKSGRSYWSFVLRGEWSDAVIANGLKAGDKISLWSFRCRGILFFALVPPTVLGS